MTKTLIDPVVLEKGIEKGIEKGVQSVAKNMLKKGKSIEEIIELTELPVEEVEKLKKELGN